MNTTPVTMRSYLKPGVPARPPSPRADGRHGGIMTAHGNGPAAGRTGAGWGRRRHGRRRVPAALRRLSRDAPAGPRRHRRHAEVPVHRRRVGHGPRPGLSAVHPAHARMVLDTSGDLAYRINVFSAVWGAAACAFVFLAMRSLRVHPWSRRPSPARWAGTHVLAALGLRGGLHARLRPDGGHGAGLLWWDATRRRDGSTPRWRRPAWHSGRI